MIVISIANTKGGVGKTSFTINIGYELSRQYNVLLLDMDEKCDLTRTLLKADLAVESDDSTILEVLQGKASLTDAVIEVYPNLNIVPGSNDIDQLIGYHSSRNLKRGLAQKELRNIDIVLIDHPPLNNIATASAFSVTDYVLIVTEAETLSIEDLINYKNKLKSIKMKRNTITLGIVANKIDMRRNLTKKKLKELKHLYNKEFFESYISTNTSVPFAIEKKIPVRNLNYRSIVVSQYQNVIQEMIKRMGDNK